MKDGADDGVSQKKVVLHKMRVLLKQWCSTLAVNDDLSQLSRLVHRTKADARPLEKEIAYFGSNQQAFRKHLAPI